jgi:membrane-associated phospholipid phosphatase
MTNATSPVEPQSARLITDRLEPKNWIILVTLLMGWHADRFAGIGWGLFAAVFTGVIPMLFIKYGQRRGYWGDRHVGRRQDRLYVLPGIMVSVIAGLALMYSLEAPSEVTALVVAMLVSLVVVLAITTVWKVSLHTAVSSGAIATLALAYGPWMLLLSPAVPVIGWSRVQLRDHTLGQVIVGTLLGAVIGGGTFVLLR